MRGAGARTGGGAPHASAQGWAAHLQGLKPCGRPSAGWVRALHAAPRQTVDRDRCLTLRSRRDRQRQCWVLRVVRVVRVVRLGHPVPGLSGSWLPRPARTPMRVRRCFIEQLFAGHQITICHLSRPRRARSDWPSQSARDTDTRQWWQCLQVGWGPVLRARGPAPTSTLPRSPCTRSPLAGDAMGTPIRRCACSAPRPPACALQEPQISSAGACSGSARLQVRGKSTFCGRPGQAAGRP